MEGQKHWHTSMPSIDSIVRLFQRYITLSLNKIWHSIICQHKCVYLRNCPTNIYQASCCSAKPQYKISFSFCHYVSSTGSCHRFIMVPVVMQIATPILCAGKVIDFDEPYPRTMFLGSIRNNESLLICDYVSNSWTLHHDVTQNGSYVEQYTDTYGIFRDTDLIGKTQCLSSNVFSAGYQFQYCMELHLFIIIFHLLSICFYNQFVTVIVVMIFLLGHVTCRNVVCTETLLS